MPKPTPQEYQQAIQHPDICFSDYELKHGSPVLNILQLPKQISGNFASVYQINSGDKKYAARCFIRDVPDIEKRYRLIDSYLDQVNLPYFVNFDFLEKGILVKGKWYPLIKLLWIDGETLDVYIARNLNNPDKILNIANKFLQLVSDLKNCSISHGDLQHGNILVENNNLRLIDYDAMYVPSLEGLRSNEVGHENYQHPYRDYKDFGIYTDNFSEWIVYLSLIVLGKNPDLWQKFYCGDDCLLFRKIDIKSPESSKVFDSLKKIKDNEIQNIFENLQYYIYSTDISQIPSITDPMLPLVDSKNTRIKVQEVETAEKTDSSWIWDQQKVTVQYLNTSVLSERVSIVGFLSLIAIAIAVNFVGIGYQTLVLYSFMGIGYQTLVLYSPALGFILLMFFLNYRYRKIPIVSEKKDEWSALKEIKKEIKRINKSRKKNEKDLKKIYNNERKEIEKIKKKQQKNRTDKQNEILTEKRRLSKVIGDLKNQIKKLNTQENRELYNELKRIQDNYLENRLDGHKLTSFSISGIGPVLTQHLRYNGIHSAADFTNTFTNYSGEALITLKIGRTRHVNGIGPVKASRLLNWRNNLLRRYLRSMPQRLDPSNENRIKANYRMKEQILNVKIKKEENATVTEISNINRKYILKDKLLNNEIQNIHEKNLDIIKKIRDEIKELNINSPKISWELNKREHYVKAYKFITFSVFIKKIFSKNES